MKLTDYPKVLLSEKRVELHLRTGYSYPNGMVDIEQLIKFAKENDYPCFAITDENTTQSYYEIKRIVESEGFEPLFGCEVEMLADQKGDEFIDIHYPVMLLAKGHDALNNLNRLLSDGLNLYPAMDKPFVDREAITKYRKGLVVGSSCNNGELLQGIRNGLSQDELEKIAEFYDYIEIQPVENYMPKDEDEANVLREQLRRMCSFGIEEKRPVIATANVSYLVPEDQIAYSILKFSDEETRSESTFPPLYYRSTEEMLEAFAFLGEDLAEEVVLTNPRCVVQKALGLDNFYEDPHSVTWPIFFSRQEECEKKFKELVYERLKNVYGDDPEKITAEQPDCKVSIVSDRLENELSDIGLWKRWERFYIYSLITRNVHDAGYLTGAQGRIGSSLVAWLSGISEINPLPAHYVCPACHRTIFPTTAIDMIGLDLPDRVCPECGELMRKDGYNISPKIYFGTFGTSASAIQLNLANGIDNTAIQRIVEEFPQTELYRANGVRPFLRHEVIHMAVDYMNTHEVDWSLDEKRRIITALSAARKTMAVDTACFYVVPMEWDIHDFSTVATDIDETVIPQVVLSALYGGVLGFFTKVFCQKDEIYQDLYELKILTNTEYDDIKPNDPAVLSLFSSCEALNVHDSKILSNNGLYGVQLLNDDRVRKVIDLVQPKTVLDIMRTYAVVQDKWKSGYEGAEKLANIVADGLPVFTNEVYNELLAILNIDEDTTYSFMLKVADGHTLSDALKDELLSNDVPNRILEHYDRMESIHDEADIASSVWSALCLLWYKVYYPKEFYFVWLKKHMHTLNGFKEPTTDCEKMRECINHYRQEKESITKDDAKTRGYLEEYFINENLYLLETLLEMKERGFDYNELKQRVAEIWVDKK